MPTERNEIGPGSGRRARSLPLWQTIVLLAIVAGAYWVTRNDIWPRAERPPAGKVAPEPSDPADRSEITGKRQIDKPRDEPPQSGTPQEDAAPAQATLQIPDVVVRDRNGNVAWRGTVELTETLARIEASERLRFAHDGIVFQNRERRLPRKSDGYYHEYIHPTPGLSGPGPQRVIRGAGGEIYYSADHYRTFITIRGP